MGYSKLRTNDQHKESISKIEPMLFAPLPQHHHQFTQTDTSSK